MNNQYSNGSYSFIINLDKNSDRNGIYKVKSGDAIKVKFSGILEFITPKAFEAISNKYMYTFDKLKKKFISKKLDTLKEKVQKSQKSNEFTKFVVGNLKKANPIIFQRNCDEDIKRILFNAYISSETPRFTSVDNFQLQVNSRVGQMMNGTYLEKNTTVYEKNYEKVNPSSRLRNTIHRMVSEVCFSDKIDEVQYTDHLSISRSNRRSVYSRAASKVNNDFTDLESISQFMDDPDPDFFLS